MAERIVKDSRGNERIQFVADGWKSFNQFAETDPVRKKIQTPQVLQELYVGRRYNLLNNNSWSHEEKVKFEAWIGSYLKPPPKETNRRGKLTQLIKTAW